MAVIGIVWHELMKMGNRGPKPVNVGLLNVWDFEFYKALHLLRDGIALPARNLPPPSGFSRSELRAVLSRLKSMSAAEYWRVQQQMATEFAENLDLEHMPNKDEIDFASHDLTEEIYWLEQTLTPYKIHAQVQRRETWNKLIRASTYAAVRKTCEDWRKLLDVRASGLTPFPEHVSANAGQFLSMKRNKRFPHSNYGDDARIDYLARGMAGVLVGVSPMTAIERLRNLKHAPGGPLWNTNERRCNCWRCYLTRSNKVRKTTQAWYENGLRKFIEIADEMKRQRS
jgi:hypothetical protein